MRLSDQAFLSALQRNLSGASQSMQRLSVQLSSGKRLQRPSDGPVATTTILSAHADLQRCLDQQETIKTGLALSSAADQPLAEITTGLNSAQQLVLRALNAATSDEARAAMASQVEGLAAQIADQANSQLGGRYLFGGSKDNAPPLVQDVSGVWQYQGNDGQLLFPVAPGRTAPANVSGLRVLNFPDAGGARAVPGVNTDVLSLLQTVAAQLRSSDLTGLAASADQVQALGAQVVQQRAQLGGYSTRLTSAQQAAKRAELNLHQVLSDNEDADIAQALLELKTLEVASQAALVAVNQVASLPSIFSQMR
ncbi:MAG TPA: flagellin [Armatimonadota bacterium]|jgi:flagellar hook-associated protein 3 FlgL